MDSRERRQTSTGTAALVGTVVGLGVVCLYLGLGLLVAGWKISDFLLRLSPSTVGYFVGMIALVVVSVGLPIAVFLRFQLVSPLVVLVLAALAWLVLGAVQGLLSLETIFGLALYAAYLSPIALVLYGVLGGGEYLFRTETSRP
ncbi:hypothetical protein LPA44_06905 [Halobacterium sp. KA-4]|uniref:hypothetical protein n=1 Tax=Halobacterium sp. KA-4 TaxID=2896367 RepID=UPI001E5556A7|nr:hypothetical protein [Halobacterium sp. KA-4]MCD2199623.1 hypothetical protein [Halobacterium sp. KA-4]